MTANIGHASDETHQALDAARALRVAGNYAEALERHEWFHANAVRINPACRGIRLSFALGDWIKLGDVYPPALASMKRIRDEGIACLKAGGGDVALFEDVAAINQQLLEISLTVSLFRQLHEESSSIAEQAFDKVAEMLLDAEEYGLFSSYAGDLEMFLASRIEWHLTIVENFRQNIPDPEQGIKMCEAGLVQLTLQLTNLARSQNSLALATRLQSMTASLVADARLSE